MSARDYLETTGKQIRKARLRRNLTVNEVAERAGTTAVTVLNVEKGLPSVSIGKVAAVLEVLGLEKDLLFIAASDPKGRELQDENLPKRLRKQKPKKKSVAKKVVVKTKVVK